MHYIVFDLEWNQPYDTSRIKRKPIDLYGEIIQIGAVKLDDNLNELDRFKVTISPEHYKKMNKRISKLTGITDEDLKDGLDFSDAFNKFSQWCGENFCMLTWGNDDIYMLRDNMIFYGISFDVMPTCYNLQVIFDNQVAGLNRQLSLTSAMELLGEPEFDAHDALNDAVCTAKICKAIDLKKGIEEYNRLEVQFAVGTPGVKPLSVIEIKRKYDSIKIGINAVKQRLFACPECKGKLNTYPFIKQNNTTYISLFKCNEGHEYFVRIRFAKKVDNTFVPIVLFYSVTEEDKTHYLKKIKLRGRKKTSGKKN